MKVVFESNYKNLTAVTSKGRIHFKNGIFETEDKELIKEMIMGLGYRLDYWVTKKALIYDDRGNVIDVSDPSSKPEIKYAKGMTAKVSIIIGTRFNPENLKNCLESLVEHTPRGYELIVVDNQATPQSKEILKKFKEKLDESMAIIETQKVLGFAEFNNLAVKAATKPYVLYLNDDTILADNWLESMVDIIESKKQCGMVGKMSLDNERKLHQLAHKNHTSKSEYAYGFCMLVRRKDAYLDEIYKDYGWEDIDLCERIKEKGQEIWVERMFPIIHLGSKSLGKFEGINDVMARNHAIYLKRWK